MEKPELFTKGAFASILLESDCMGRSVADRRKAMGLTQTELALASRLTRAQISAVETGRHAPNVHAALAIAEALGTTVEDLFGESASVRRQRHVPALGTEPSGTVAVLAVRVGEVLIYHPLPNHGASGSSWERADGLFRDGRVELFDDADPSGFAVAGCDPALGLAGSLLPARGPQRLVAISASTSEAIEALDARHVHGAVVHGLPGHLRRSSVPVRPFVIARWRVGLASRAGFHPKLDQLARGRITAVRRDAGAEVQRALERALAPHGGGDRITGPVAAGHLDAARLVAHGSADVAATIETAALAYGLDFSPLEEHRVELRIAKEWEDHPGARALVELIASPTFHRRLEALGGYDLTGRAAPADALAR
jgi:DNA-binding XRE family transcriptional regulator